MLKKSKPEKNIKEPKSKKISQQEFEKKVIELAKQGVTSEKIGEALRAQGIHSKEYSEKISRILKGSNLYVNPDMKNVEVKLERIKRHCGKSKQDKRAIREKERVFSQLRKLKKYSKTD